MSIVTDVSSAQAPDTLVRASLQLTPEHGDLTNPEMMVEEPPGFDGTSFASHMLAGLTAPLTEPKYASATAGCHEPRPRC